MASPPGRKREIQSGRGAIPHSGRDLKTGPRGRREGRTHRARIGAAFAAESGRWQLRQQRSARVTAMASAVQRTSLGDSGCLLLGCQGPCGRAVETLVEEPSAGSCQGSLPPLPPRSLFPPGNSAHSVWERVSFACVLGNGSDFELGPLFTPTLALQRHLRGGTFCRAVVAEVL